MESARKSMQNHVVRIKKYPIVGYGVCCHVCSVFFKRIIQDMQLGEQISRVHLTRRHGQEYANPRALAHARKPCYARCDLL